MDRGRLGLLLALCFSAPRAHAAGLTLLTEEDPPFSMSGAGGQPTGFVVDLVNALQQALGGERYPITIQPWPRVYRAAQEEPNVAAFAMSRTREREALFQWVGPVVENDWVLVAPKASHLKLTHLEEARTLGRIGAVRDYASTNHLLAQGFDNLDIALDRRRNALKLGKQRVAAIVSADASYEHELSEAGLNPGDYEVVLTFRRVQMYIAFSKRTDASRVVAWQAALERLKGDGSFAKLHQQWLPNHRLPGPARPGEW